MNTERYQRQMLLPEFGTDGQKKLAKAKVLVIGAGGLASPVLLYLAGAGIGTIGIADGDTVSLDNLHRQIIHTGKTIGTNKAASAEARIGELNGDVTVETYPVFLTSDNGMELLEGYDFIIDAVDRFETKFLINDLCVRAKKPFCYAGVVAMHGQVMTYVPGKGPCLRCIFEEMPPPGSVPSAKEAGVFGPVVGVIGSIQASEALKYFLGQELLTGKLYQFDAKTMSGRTARFPKASSRCPVCGAPVSVRP